MSSVVVVDSDDDEVVHSTGPLTVRLVILSNAKPFVAEKIHSHFEQVTVAHLSAKNRSIHSLDKSFIFCILLMVHKDII